METIWEIKLNRYSSPTDFDQFHLLHFLTFLLVDYGEQKHVFCKLEMKAVSALHLGAYFSLILA